MSTADNYIINWHEQKGQELQMYISMCLAVSDIGELMVVVW